MSQNDENDSSDAGSGSRDIQFHVAPDLDYVYRDVFNVFVGSGDVIIEFGNQHRAMPEHATIANRIVMTVGNAYGLIQTLQKTLEEAQIKLHEQIQAQKKSGR